ncbi:hypothetical protein BLA6863_05625 [Burkholderia lata]|uniref:Uncharacterized protein n=2 Tax=Burkholderia lata (strain ATCC 17760 / DSM 23089 / LMG 22485 / NCIMB 9086 / R18194 / 383) TaxID=482957 RepID=A0A6P2Q3S2_BURL3|nr:hypothetical protein BLA6863_05625 [Burkholderia lata]
MVFSMMSEVGAIVSIALIAVIVSMSVVLPRIISTTRDDTTITDGSLVVADVVEIAQTGVMLNQVPQMRIVLNFYVNDGPREIAIRQFVDLGNMPRAGERVRVIVDKINSKRVRYLNVVLDGV